MKREDLLRAVGEIDEELIWNAKSENRGRRSHRFPAWAAVAAALVLLLAAAWVAFPGLHDRSGGEPGENPAGQTTNLETQDEAPVDKIKPYMPNWQNMEVPEKPVLPAENRNIPAGSNVVETEDGKWIVAFTTDTDIYSHMISPNLWIYVISKEPMDPGTMFMRADGKPDQAYDFQDWTGDELKEYMRTALWFAYNGVSAVEEANWHDYIAHRFQRISLADTTDEMRARYEELWRMQDESMAYRKKAEQDLFIYASNYRIWECEEETVLHSFTLSWPGVEQKVDIGELRIHPGSPWDGWEVYPIGFADRDADPDPDCGLGYERYSMVAMTDQYPFGPELAKVQIQLCPEEDVTIRSVALQSPKYQVVDVQLYRWIENRLESRLLSEEGVLTIPAEEEWTLRAFVTGPGLSALCTYDWTEMEVAYECGGRRDTLHAEVYFQPYIATGWICAMVADNVDMQDYYEMGYYDPYDEFDPSIKSVYDKIGWTAQWDAKYGA